MAGRGMAGKHEQKTEDRLAEQAAGWVARLQSRDATDHDRADFQRWVQRDPAHHAAFEEFKALWAELRDVPIQPGRLGKLRVSRRATIANIVAIGLIAVLLTSLYGMGALDRLRADHYTAIGEVRSVTLADGTRVDLNTDTAIAVRYAANERRIELLRGEAFFDVVKDASRPFIVDDGTLRAKAVGTGYSVRTASSGYLGDVQVEEGRVEVIGGTDKVLLDAGNVADVLPQGKLAIRKAEVANDTAWRSGKLVFSGKPLRDVLATLSRYRNGRIIVLDKAAGDSAVSGIFDVTDTDQALDVLEENLPVTVTRLTSMMVVVRSRWRSKFY